MARACFQLAQAVFGICLFWELVQGTFHIVGVKYRVALNVFSGRENPKWDVDWRSPLYDRISWQLNECHNTPLNGNLGYEGFVVEATNAMGQTAWKTIGRQTNRNMESILLRSCPSTQGLGWHVLNHIYTGITGQYRQKVLPVSSIVNIVKAPVARVPIKTSNDNSHIHIKHRLYRKKRQAGFCFTRFNPRNWNFGAVQSRNNCYNYATNRRTNTFAQPGRFSGRMYRRITPSEVYQASLRDGLISLSGPNDGPGCITALVIWPPGIDYHFLRKDYNGLWSQKNGRTEARNVDNRGARIFDPQSADRGPYTDFVGWLGVGANVRIR